jgi:hypothetical protein
VETCHDLPERSRKSRTAPRLSFALDRVFALLPPAVTREQLEHALAAARAENRGLRARIDDLERERYPEERGLDTYEVDLERRLLRGRERGPDEEI